MPSGGANDEIQTRCLILCRDVWYPFEVKRDSECISLGLRRGARCVVTLDVGQRGVLSFTTEHDQSPRQRRFASLDQLEQLLRALASDKPPAPG